jgi:hypothetical protein
LGLLQFSYQWSYPGHIVGKQEINKHLVYMIARNEIGKDICNQIDNLMKVMTEPQANYPNVYEYSIWPDDIKSRYDYMLLNGWHVNWMPIYEGIDPSKVKYSVDPKFNVVHTVVSKILL